MAVLFQIRHGSILLDSSSHNILLLNYFVIESAPNVYVLEK